MTIVRKQIRDVLADSHVLDPETFKAAVRMIRIFCSDHCPVEQIVSIGAYGNDG